ncbi:MAG TPA: ABC transporter ATP-binding protein [Burkholderiales bacterium]|jgi:branched-chain amino acid transport system ATP-binding protein|nr:ABC transporter ATP-binding protein [Burkholderiales bacterium]
MLEIEALGAGYGAVPVLNGVTIRVGAGEFVAIVGPNGAGKTTLFKTISGIVPPMSGAIRFEGNDLLAVAPSARPHLGIAHVPEGRQVFPSLTVLENLEMGAGTEAGRRNWAENLDKVYTWFPVLAERASAQAGALSGGQQQMLAIARGLASSPKLLMLDEPSLGLAPAVADEIFERIVTIHAGSGLTVLMVEQRVAEALHFATRGYVLEAGRVVLEGSHDELKSNDRIRQAYLGM